MKPRKEIVEIFSTFLRLEADRVTGWIPDPRLQRSMTACVKTAAEPQPDHRWALHWHRIWQQQSAPWAEAHLSAYLQETCYWVAWKMARNQRQLGWLGDLFQVAIARVPKLLKHFKSEYSDSFKKYAELVFENSLKDWLRVQQQVEICTDWALLYRLSRKRWLAALQGAGWHPQQIGQYTLAWECWQELVTVDQATINALHCPNAQTWQAIATAYNAARLSQVGPATPTCSPAQIEQWLLNCAKLVRQFLKPEVVSVDAPQTGWDSGTLLDTYIDARSSPMERLFQQEEAVTRTQQLTQLQAALATALATLNDSELALLQDYYRDQLTQAAIAKQRGLQQYQVSRQLERIRRSLLKKIVQWSQETLHISPTPTVVDAMSQALELWLGTQWQDDEVTP
jgi:RNA polymerase sigma factor (sigma-70 family)